MQIVFVEPLDKSVSVQVIRAIESAGLTFRSR